MLRVVTDDEGRAEMRSALDEIVLEGARRMLAAALEAEVDAYIAALAGERDERGQRLVVRNGHAEPRTITTAAGRIEVTAPRVNDNRVDDDRRAVPVPQLDPAAVGRKSPKVAEVLPLMYLHGMSQRRLRAGAGRVLRLGGGAVGVGDHPADDPVAGRAAGLRRAAPRSTGTTCTCGPTACTSTSASTRNGCAAWSSSVSGPTAPRSWSPSPTATGSRPSRGPTCCATSTAAGCGHRCSPSVTARSGSGVRCARCSPRPGPSAAGCTRSPTSSPRCRPRCSRPPGGCWPRSVTPRTATTPSRADQRVRRRVRRQVAQGRRQDRRRPRAAARLLRLPRRALDPPQDHQPDRVDLRDRPAAHQGHQGPRLPGRRAGHGLQAHRSRPRPLAGRQRAAPRRPRPRRRTLREGGDRRTRTARSGSRRVINDETRSTGLDDSSRAVALGGWPSAGQALHQED